MPNAAPASGSPHRPMIDALRSVGMTFMLVLCLGVFTSGSVALAEDGPPIHFKAEISAEDQSAFTPSDGQGVVRFVLERATLELSWNAEFSALTSAATALAAHGPDTVGGNAGVLFDLAPEGNIRSPVTGSVILTQGQLQYLLTGKMYVNLRTRNYPLGELRGQVRRQRPEWVQQSAAE